MARDGIEPPTHGASIHCSTNWATEPYFYLLREQDLNLRPSGYEPDELPSCSIPRQYDQGGCGIRTHARFYTPDGFQDRSLQPDLGNPPKRYSPYGIRTRVTAVKRRCLNPLTNGPYNKLKIPLYSANRARTCDIMINSHALYQLSYGG